MHDVVASRLASRNLCCCNRSSSIDPSIHHNQHIIKRSRRCFSKRILVSSHHPCCAQHYRCELPCRAHRLLREYPTLMPPLPRLKTKTADGDDGENPPWTSPSSSPTGLRAMPIQPLPRSAANDFGLNPTTFQTRLLNANVSCAPSRWKVSKQNPPYPKILPLTLLIQQRRRSDMTRTRTA